LSHEVVRYLISWGADINALDDRGYTPAHLAIKNGAADALATIDIVKQLFDVGANLLI
jgi:ankyrin repeat protein